MRCVIAAVLLCAAGPVASAEDLYIDDESPFVEAPAIIDDDAGGIVTGPRVYGWSFAPPNCGTFKYWNGEYCADARFEPPSEE
jgi:hypothetical protein